jgi:outer membrane protein assembly factor BamD
MAFNFAGARLMRGLSLTVRLTMVTAVAALAIGCATGGAKKPPTGTLEPDRFLLEHGNEALAKKRWVVAREYFRQLVDSYPQSPFRASAKLGLGDTYMGEHSAESFVLAINEFREFLSYYPTHDLAYYAQYKLAMAHYYQMRAPMRDQTETRAAISELQSFVDKYPNSPLIGEARQHLREAKDRLDDWDLGVAVVYYHLKWYLGTVDRLKPLVDGKTSDPGYTNRDAAYFYLGEALTKANHQAEALPYYERLVKEFEKSEYLERAQKRIAELKAEMAAKEKGEDP